MKIDLNEYRCQKCGKKIEFDELAVNFGWCNDCFDESFEEDVRSGRINIEDWRDD